MIQECFVRRVVSVCLVFSFLVPFFAGVCAGFEDYGYKKKDKVEEERQFIARLKEDKRKVEIAIASTKALIDKSMTKPYLPELYLRLAELYIEKSRIVYFIRKTEAPSAVKSLDYLESNALKNQAIEIYQRILGNFPDFEDRDKVHFFMAHEYRELGQIDEMVRQYRAIITKYKESHYVPESYLLLGDYFFNAKQDLEMARRHYKAVLNYPRSSAIAVARYKLAWCHINKAEFKDAIKLLEECVTSTDVEKLDVDTYKKKVDIKLEALIDMAYCYTESYKDKNPQEAIAYFKGFSWSRPAYTAVLEKLAYRYLIKKKWSHAATIYRQLSTLQQNPEKLLEYSRNIFECVQAIGTFKDVDADVALIIKALKRQKYSVHIPEEEKEKNIRDYELYARDIITHLHHKAREKKSIEDFRLAADAYELYVGFFDESPVLEDMEFNYAEALFSAQRYLEAGKQYEKLANRMPPSNSQKKEHIYSAVISYYNALKHKKDLNYYQIVYARAGLKVAGKWYAKDFPDGERVPEILFNVAWVTYDEGKHDEAIAEFSKHIERYPKGKEAKVAVHLILDAFHMKEDYEGLINYGQKIVHDSRIEKELRSEVAKIVHAAEGKIISSLTVAALEDWEAGKTGLIDYAEQYKSSGLGEEALNALVVSSKEKGDLETMFSAGSQLISQYPASSRVEDTLGVLIDSSLKTAQFRVVVSYLEEFATRLPKHRNTKEFLCQAGHIREDLGQYDLANKNYQQIIDHQRKRSEQEQMVFAMADNAGRMGNIDSAIKILKNREGYLTTVGKIKADARIADFYFQKKEFKKARKYRKKASEAYRIKYAKKDTGMNDAMARMVYNSLRKSHVKYFNIQLKDRIDNKIVNAKTKLLEQLEKGYDEVVKYQSSEWALAACHGIFEINKEFGRFLKEAPLPPGLTQEQKEQYAQILGQKALAYEEKAAQYLQTCIKQANKWEVCDPKLAKYFIDPSDLSGISRGFDYFSPQSRSVEIGVQSLKHERLRVLHYQLIQDPKDTETLAALAIAYVEMEDFRHSILIAQKALEEKKDETEPLGVLYNTLGVSYLYTRDDGRAKEAFKKALEIDSNNIGAKVNLAGLYKYYGHIAKANGIYDTLPNGTVKDARDLIHPQARELYYEHIRVSQ